MFNQGNLLKTSNPIGGRRGLTSILTPQMQQAQIQGLSNVAQQFWNPSFKDKPLTTTGLSPADVAAKLGSEFRGQDVNPYINMGFNTLANKAGLDPNSDAGKEFSLIFDNYYNGNQDFQPGVQSQTNLNDYQDELERVTKPQQMGGFGKTLGKITKIGVPLAMGAIGAGALSTALGLGSLGTNVARGVLQGGISGGADGAIKGGLTGGITSGLGDFANGTLTSLGETVGNASSSIGKGIDSFTSGISDFIPDAGGFGSKFTNAITSTDALKGAGLSGFGTALTGGDPEDIILSAALGGVKGASNNIVNESKLTPIERLGTPYESIDTMREALSGTEFANPSYTTSGESMFNLGSITDYLGDGLKAAVPSAISTGIGYLGNKKAQDAQLDELRKAQGLLQPYLDSGTAANQQLQDLLSSGELTKSFTPSDFQNSEGYQFRLSEGLSALDKSLAARGSLNSGRAIKAAQEYGQGLASEEYGDEYNRFMQDKMATFNQLNNLAGQGNATANQIGNIYGAMGDINANATASNFSNLGSTLSQFLRGTGQFDDYFGQQDENELLKAILGRA